VIYKLLINIVIVVNAFLLLLIVHKHCNCLKWHSVILKFIVLFAIEFFCNFENETPHICRWWGIICITIDLMNSCNKTKAAMFLLQTLGLFS